MWSFAFVCFDRITSFISFWLNRNRCLNNRFALFFCSFYFSRWFVCHFNQKFLLLPAPSLSLCFLASFIRFSVHSFGEFRISFYSSSSSLSPSSSSSLSSANTAEQDFNSSFVWTFSTSFYWKCSSTRRRMSCARVCLRLHFSLASARPAVTTKIHFRPSQKTLFFTFVSSFSKCTAQNVSNKLSRLKCEKNGIKTTLKSRIAAHNRNQFAQQGRNGKIVNCEARNLSIFHLFHFLIFESTVEVGKVDVGKHNRALARQMKPIFRRWKKAEGKNNRKPNIKLDRINGISNAFIVFHISFGLLSSRGRVWVCAHKSQQIDEWLWWWRHQLSRCWFAWKSDNETTRLMWNYVRCEHSSLLQSRFARLTNN